MDGHGKESPLSPEILAIAAFAAGALLGGGAVLFLGRQAQRGLTERARELEAKLDQRAEEIRELERAKARLEESEQWLQNAREEMTNLFKASANDALEQNRQQFKDRLDPLIKEIEGNLKTHKAKVDGVVNPLSDALKQLEGNITTFKKEWTGGYQVIKDNFATLQSMQKELGETTAGLRNALKSSTVRGRWGEVELRRIVELAGLTEHVDFSEQSGTSEVRPDMTVYLPENVVVPVDAKTPLDAYLDAVEAEDEGERARHMARHAKAVRDTITRLSRKGYWEAIQQQHDSRIDFVVMFVPLESALGAAFAHDPKLLEDAIDKGVFPTTPVTLLALLRTVSYGWQQVQLAKNAKNIADAGRELYDRFRVFFEHFDKVGDGIARAGKAYEGAVGSYESRLHPSLDKFLELGVQAKQALPDSLPSTPAPRKAERPLPEGEAPEDACE